MTGEHRPRDAGRELTTAQRHGGVAATVAGPEECPLFEGKNRLGKL